MSMIESLMAFLSMGGYGAYVWGAYGVTALLMAIEVAALRGKRATASLV